MHAKTYVCIAIEASVIGTILRKNKYTLLAGHARKMRFHVHNILKGKK